MATQNSLQSRIILRTVLASLLAVLIAGFFAESYVDKTISKEIEQRAITLSRLLGSIILNPDTRQHLPSVIDSLHSEDDIASLRIIEGTPPPVVVASYDTHEQDNPYADLAPPIHLQLAQQALSTKKQIIHKEYEGNYTLFTPISWPSPDGAETSYIIALELDTATLYAQINKELTLLIAGITILFIGTLAFVFHLLQKHIFAPIRLIESTIRRHAEGDSTARSPQDFQGELGSVATALNSLLEKTNESNELYEAQNLKLHAYASQLEGKTLELDLARQTAERATGLKSEFLANMSHEIRTPLNSVIGMNSLLLETPLTEQQQQYASTALSSAEGLLVIINDILDFSKIESGKLQLENITFDLPQLLDAILSSFRPKAADKQIDILATHLAPLPRYVAGDPVRIRQILTNLIDNAIKFTRVGYVKLFSQIIDPADHINDAIVLRFSIKDTGVGIPADALRHIFDKFTQADTSTTRKFGGTGLGLAICRQLAEMMGGEVGVDSTLGEGSVFWFTIRLQLSDSSHAMIENEPANNSLTISDKTLLLVEDNDVNRFFATEILKRYGCGLLYAVNGVEAVAMYRDHPEIALIFMDCQMPELDGFEATQRIRHMEQEAGRPHTPIIALTALAMKGDKERCIASGMDDYLSKPLRKNELQEKLLVWLGTADDKKEAGFIPPSPQQIAPQSGINWIDCATIEEVREFTGAKFQSIIQMYLNDTQKHITIIQDGYLKKELQQDVRRAAHSMKSSSLHLGATNLSRLAEEIEAYFAPGGHTTSTPETVAATIRELPDIFDKTQKAFSAYLHKDTGQ